MTFLAEDKLNTKQAAELLGCSARRIQQLCGEGVFVGAQKAKGEWLIPANSCPLFLAVSATRNKNFLKDITTTKREEVIRRLTVLRQLDQYITLEEKYGKGKTESIKAFAAQQNIPLRTLQRWRSLYLRYGILGLVDSRGRSNEAQIEIEVCRVGARIELGQILVDSLRRRDREQLLSLINSGEVGKDEVQRIVRKLLRRKE